MFRKKQIRISENVENLNLYEILNVNRNAGEDEIHFSFYKRMKNLRAKKDKESFAIVYTAHSVLTHPEFKKRYDNLLELGKDVEKCLNLYHSALFTGSTKIAEIHAKKMVEVSNNAPDAIILLAQIQHGLKKFKTSAETMRQLVELYPGKTFYRNELADFLFSLYLTVEDKEIRLKYLEEARTHYLKSIELDPSDTSVYCGLAETFLATDSFEEAYNITEQAVNVKKLDSFRNFDPLLMGCKILAVKKDYEKFEDQLRRVEDCIPMKNENAVEYAAKELVGACFTLLKNEHGDEARAIIYAACRVKPGEKVISSLADNIENLIKTAPALMRIQCDEEVLPPIKSFAEFLFKGTFGKPDENDLDDMVETINVNLMQYPSSTIHQNLEKVKLEHPVIWNLAPEMWRSVGGIVKNTKEGKTIDTGTTSRVLILILVGLIIILRRIVCDSMFHGN